jgi:hypothetical protein
MAKNETTNESAFSTSVHTNPAPKKSAAAIAGPMIPATLADACNSPLALARCGSSTMVAMKAKRAGLKN